MEKSKVAVVVEDDDDIRDLVTAVLQQAGFTVHESTTGFEGLAMIAEQRPDVVTLDIGLPDIDGFEVARRMRGFTDAYLIMLTSRAEEVDTVIALEIGADDYVTKPFRPRELRARIDRIMSRGRHASAAAPTADVTTRWRHNGVILDQAAHTVTVDGSPVHLTVTEFTLLRSILSGGKRVHTKAELVAGIRDEDPATSRYVPGVDDRLLDVHVANLRRKLADDPRRPRCIMTVRGVGYRLAPAAESAT